MRRTALAILVVLLAPLTASGIEISSVYPPVVAAGTPVTVIGGPFSEATKVDLGGNPVDVRLSGTRQLVFVAPQLPVGEYALFVRDGDQVSSQTLSLRIELPPPAILAIEPDHLDECSDTETRQVGVRVKDFQEGAQLLLDGAVIPYQHGSDQTFNFVPPPLRAGSYGLQLVNPDGKKSLPHTLWVSSRPEIDSISAGDDFVNYYQIVIRGKNFFQRSVLVLNEYSGSFSDLPPRQQAIPAQGGNSFHDDRLRIRRMADSVSYQDCHTLIYNRFPPTGQNQRLVFRVSNPNGEQTPPYEVSLP